MAERTADRPSGIVHWYEVEFPALKAEDIVVFPNGIDMVEAPTAYDESSRYEDKCFATLQPTSETQFALGPRFVNNTFDRSNLSFFPRPDAFVFERLSEDEWRLIGLHEYKMSIFPSKFVLKGGRFGKMVTALFQYPDFLPRAMRQTISHMIQTPSVIEIPSLDQLTVTYVARYWGKEPAYKTADFKSIHIAIPK